MDSPKSDSNGRDGRCPSDFLGLGIQQEHRSLGSVCHRVRFLWIRVWRSVSRLTQQRLTGFLHSFPSLWPRMITVIAKDDISSPPTIISLLLFIMGVGNVISGPIADALLATKGFKHASFAYGIDSYVSNPNSQQAFAATPAKNMSLQIGTTTALDRMCLLPR
jgi:hypothetical protein